MRPTLLIPLVLAAGLVSGCGDPAPSTTLAPDQKPLDASKLSKEQVDRMLEKGHGERRIDPPPARVARAPRRGSLATCRMAASLRFASVAAR